MSEDEKLMRLMEPIAPEGFLIWRFYGDLPGIGFKPKNADIGGDGGLLGAYGIGSTAAEAVADCWRRFTELGPGLYIALNGLDREKRAHWRWNGMTWVSVPVPAAKAAEGDDVEGMSR